MKKLVSLFLALILALGLSIPAMAEGTTLSVAAIETAYGSEIWQEVTAAFTELTGIDMQRVATMGIHDSMQDMIVCLIGTVALLPSTSRYFRRGVPGIFMRPFDEFLHKNAIFTSHLRDA